MGNLTQTKTQSLYSDQGVEFYIEPLYGLRVWSLRDYLLLGLRGYSWHPGVNVAECLKTLEERCSGLEESCACGFYAFWHQPRAALSYTYLNSLTGHAASQLLPRIYGVVRSYGRVVVGQTGFRAEKSEVVALSNIATTWWTQPEYTKFAKVPPAFKQTPYYITVEAMLKEWPCKKPV